jgi:hypothetical protein
MRWSNRIRCPGVPAGNVDGRFDAVALEVRIIAYEVLYSGEHTVRLNAANIGGGEAPTAAGPPSSTRSFALPGGSGAG